MILIIGTAQEEHSAYMARKLQARGARTMFLDTLQFPASLCISLQPDDPAQSSLCEGPGQPGIPLTDIHSVYWRYHMGTGVHPEITDPFLRDMAMRETESALGSLFRSMTCRWVNSPEAIEQHRYKGYQLHLLKRAGLRIPHTLMSNDPQAVREFYNAQGGQVIYKPVRGGAHTAKLGEADLSDQRLKELAKAPVQFQEFIPGTDIRVYLVGDELFPAEIRSTTLDFRDDHDARLVPVTLPDTVADDCRTLARTLGLVFSGIDVRRTPDGEYVFLEGNPSPMFIHFEAATGYPISDRLADLLLAPNP